MSRARKRGDAVDLKDVLATLSLLRPPRDFEGPPLADAVWERAVGTRIAHKSEPWRLEQGVLYVRVVHSVWASELGLLAPDICEKLSEAGVLVKGLRFTVGRILREPRPAEPPARRAPRAAPLPPEVQRGLHAIFDDALRDAIGRAAATAIGEFSEREARTAPKATRRAPKKPA